MYVCLLGTCVTFSAQSTQSTFLYACFEWFFFAWIVHTFCFTFLSLFFFSLSIWSHSFWAFKPNDYASARYSVLFFFSSFSMPLFVFHSIWCVLFQFICTLHEYRTVSSWNLRRCLSAFHIIRILILCEHDASFCRMCDVDMAYRKWLLFHARSLWRFRYFLFFGNNSNFTG